MSLVIKDQVVTGFVLEFSPDALLSLLALIFAATITPYGLLAMGLRKVKASRAGIILLIEPVSVMIMGVLILNQPLTPWDLAGAALILSATVLVSVEERFGRLVSRTRKMATSNS